MIIKSFFNHTAKLGFSAILDKPIMEIFCLCIISYDWVEVHDGSSMDSPIIGRKRCGSHHSMLESIVSTTNELLVHFHSDYSVTRQGFKILATNGKSTLKLHFKLKNLMFNLCQSNS